MMKVTATTSAAVVGLTILLLCDHAASSALSKAVDLTHRVAENYTLAWPSSDPFRFRIVHRGDTAKFYYETNTFTQSEHSGTHTDAPAHFASGRWRTSDIPFQRLAGPAAVVDISARASLDPDTRLTVDDLTEWESRHGRIPDGAVVVLRSGRGKFYGDKRAYFGAPDGVFEADPKDTAHLHFPGFHPDAAQWLVDNRNVVGAATDTASMDYGQSSDFEVHQILGEANIWAVENLANAEALPETGYTIFNMVHKLDDGSGGPSRVFAMPSSSSVSSRSLIICIVVALTFVNIV